MLRTSVVVLAALLSLTGTPNYGHAAQKWTVKGKVMVQHLLPELTEFMMTPYQGVGAGGGRAGPSTGRLQRQ